MEEDFLQKLRDIPIVDLALKLGISVKRNKANCFKGHDVASPSLNFHLERNFWHCFGCHIHGDTISLVEHVLGLDFLPACSWLAENWGYGNPSKISRRNRRPPSRPKPRKVLPANPPRCGDSELYSWLISHCEPVLSNVGMKYLHTHGISNDTIDRFKIVEMKNPWRAYRAVIKNFGIERAIESGLVTANGQAPLWSGYSLIFPFFCGSKIEYLQARRLPGVSGPKFVTPRNIEQKIFNTNAISLLTPGMILHICEGVPDALALESVGLTAIGILGSSSFRKEWVDQLLPFDLVVVPDADPAGQAFGKSLKTAFAARSKSIRFATPQIGKDASEVIYRSNNAELS